jgi:membrane-associated phospholipid phosphatase
MTYEATGNADPQSRRWLKIVFIFVALCLWHLTQALIKERGNEKGAIVDAPHRWTEQVNNYLRDHEAVADVVLILSSLIIDCLAVFLLARSVFGPSMRPFLGLLILFALRQLSQGLVALPPPPGMIWPDGEVRAFPAIFGIKIPSLLVTYEVGNDFFFSGHTALAVFGAVELARLRRRWLTVAAVVIAVFQATVVIVLRAHWTMDVITGAAMALYVAYIATLLAPRCDRWLAR